MKRVVITGVSRGIGKATAEKFLQEGWHVTGTSTSGSAQIDHPCAELYTLDLSSPQSIAIFGDTMIKKGERIDVLVNNAAVSLHSGNGILDVDVLRKTLEINLIGLIDLTERLLPLINNGGHVVNMSSQLASLTETNGSHASSYKISKVGVNMYTRILASRIADRDIRVSSYNPGWVKTDMGGAGAPRPPSAPAREIFDLANSKPESGFFWYQGKKMNW